MTENIEKDQLENICSSLLKGFIEWIDINDGPEKAVILDSAYQFKLSMLEQENETLQKKYFISSINILFRLKLNNFVNFLFLFITVIFCFTKSA